MLDSLDADAVRRWCDTGLAALRRHQHEIDELNVYPVPDGDTGTNLVLTMNAAAEHLAAAPPADVATTMASFARGALLGARGNSGVIVSQLLRGLADAFDATRVTGSVLAGALTRAADSAYRAVAEPVEGTMLSVARAAGLAANALGVDDLGRVAVAAARGAADALAKTPDQLPALARAGVVDAGGRGLVVLLDALVEVVTGKPAPVVAVAAAPRRAVARETGSLDFAYEVQFLLDASAPAVEVLKSGYHGMGDSLVVVGVGDIGGSDLTGASAPTWNVHVHVNDVGGALEAALAVGRPHRISVTHFADQIAADQGAADQLTAERAAADQAAAEQAAAEQLVASAAGHDHDGAFEPAAITPPPEAEPRGKHKRATIVVATGDGLAALFEAEGAAVVDGPNPSTAELLDAIRATGATRVVVLPNAAATRATAAAAGAEARKDGVRVSVVPTRSPVQVLAALAVRDGGRRFEDDVIAMAEAAGACRYAEVTYASKEALTVAGRCEAGDVLGLVEGEVNLIGKDLAETCRALLDRLLAGGGELVTMLIGADAPRGFADALQAHVTQKWPFVEAQIYDGGQPFHPLLVGVE